MQQDISESKQIKVNYSFMIINSNLDVPNFLLIQGPYFSILIKSKESNQIHLQDKPMFSI